MIVTIIPQKLFLNRHLKKLKVAAYCRVSTKQEHQSDSLKAQMEYYESYIKNYANWIFVDIYMLEIY
jgi:site-specific DNA recombinase